MTENEKDTEQLNLGVAYLRDDFASFVGWASCPSLVFQGARVAHPTRIIS
ncbi:hypothetical protein [Nostoc sp. PCC 9305]